MNIRENAFQDNDYIYKTTKSNLTLNQYGKMSLSENPHFKLARSMMDKSKPILEIGCAFGYTTKILLKDGFNVIANDLDQRHLDILVESLENEEHYKKLILKPGNLVQLSFEENSLNGIIGLNVIHFLDCDQIRDFFHKSYKWLSPNGLLVLSTLSPYFLIYKENKQTGQEKLKSYYKEFNNKIEWPGFTDRIKFFENKDEREKVWLRNGPNKMNLISAEILIREAVLAGFNILKVEHFHENENGYVESLRTDEIRVASIICIKENIFN